MSDNAKKYLLVGFASAGMILLIGLKFGWFEGSDVPVEKGLASFEKTPKNTNKKSNWDAIKEKNKQKLEESRLNKSVKSLDSFYDNAKSNNPFEEKVDSTVNNDDQQDRGKLEQEQKEVIVKYVAVPARNEEQLSDNKPTRRRRSRRNGNSFYGSNGSTDNSGGNGEGSEYTKAVIHGDHSLRSGDNVNIRLTQDLIWKENKIPKGTFITGTAKLQRGRMNIEISDLLVSGSVVPVSAKVYDNKDASEGLYVPGAVDKEIKDDIISDAIDESTVRVNIPFIGSVKTGAKKKAQDRVVKVLGGHKVLIKVES